MVAPAESLLPLGSTIPGELPVSPLLTRAQLIEQIVALNPTARPEFLVGFSIAELTNYLDHLQVTVGPRLGSRWERRGDSPAIMAREPADGA